MYYLSSRHYDPATRQFLSKDLSRNDGEQSAYQYCLGNPVGNVDPTGYFSWGSLWNGVKKAASVAWKAHKYVNYAMNPWMIPAQFAGNLVMKGLTMGATQAITHTPGLKKTVQWATESSAYYADKYESTHNPVDWLYSKGAGLWSEKNCGSTAVAVAGLVAGGVAAARAGAADAVISEGMADAASGAKLRAQLATEEAFNADGTLTGQALSDSRMFMPPSKFETNLSIPGGFGKYAYDFEGPSGPGQIHFYGNPSTGEPWYGLDYKWIAQQAIGRSGR